MQYLVIILVLITSSAYANAQSSISMDEINREVNQQFDHIPNNCLIVAKEKQRLLLKHGIVAEIIIIQPTFATMKHAVLCVNGKILDNGDIANNIFSKNELSNYGKVL